LFGEVVKVLFFPLNWTFWTLSNNYIETSQSGVIRETNLKFMKIILQVIQKIEEERQLFIRIMRDIER